MSDDDGAVFSGAGSFRVDRERALEKLSAFGMERPELFLLPWVRCAVAARARDLAVDSGTGLSVRFDGRVFSREELSDPYAALFAEEPEARLRQFALGLLTCLRTGPKAVVVESGIGADRLRLTARSPRELALEPAPSDVQDTVIRVRWPLVSLWAKPYAAAAAARSAAVLVPEAYLFDGLPPPARRTSGPRTAEFEEGGLRGAALLPEPGAAHSSVTFCVLGVAVETVQTWLPWSQADARVNDDGFTLTASQSSVVEDGRHRAALDAVAAASERLLTDAARAVTREPSADPSLAPVLPWLFEAAGRLLTDPAADAGRPLLKALWDAPLFVDAALQSLSLRELAEQRARLGAVPWSRASCPGRRPPQRVALCSREHGDRELECLKTRFGPDLREMTELIESLARAP